MSCVENSANGTATSMSPPLGSGRAGGHEMCGLGQHTADINSPKDRAFHRVTSQSLLCSIAGTAFKTAPNTRQPSSQVTCAALSYCECRLEAGLNRPLHPRVTEAFDELGLPLPPLLRLRCGEGCTEAQSHAGHGFRDHAVGQRHSVLKSSSITSCPRGVATESPRGRR